MIDSINGRSQQTTSKQINPTQFPIPNEPIGELECKVALLEKQYLYGVCVLCVCVKRNEIRIKMIR
jgi:hypothetical protein